jgi:hypothetical protein
MELIHKSLISYMMSYPSLLERTASPVAHGHVHVHVDVLLRVVLVYTRVMKFLLLIICTGIFPKSGWQCIFKLNPKYFSFLFLKFFIYLQSPENV